MLKTVAPINNKQDNNKKNNKMSSDMRSVIRFTNYLTIISIITIRFVLELSYDNVKTWLR